MKITKQEYIICDVCSREVYSSEWANIKFVRDNQDFNFDSCYGCLTGDEVRSVYRKIISFFKKGDEK